MLTRNYKLYVHIAPNGKKYYGITKQKPEQRWRNGKGYSDNQHFVRAIDKYGWDNIEHIVLQEGLDIEEAKELEQYMIQWYDTANRAYGYNISLGGDACNMSEETRKKKSELVKGEKNPMYGKPVPESTRKKISDANKGENNFMYGKHHSEETKQKISNALKGKCRSEESRKKQSESVKGEKNPWYGKHPSKETRKKMSDAQKGKYTGKDNHNARSVICITTNSVFYTATEGGRYYNANNGSITSCCRGKQKSAGKLPDGTKLVWKYIDIIEL